MQAEVQEDAARETLNAAVFAEFLRRHFQIAGREVVVLYFDGATVGSVVAGRTGKFNTHIQVPAAAGPGNHTVEASGR